MTFARLLPFALLPVAALAQLDRGSITGVLRDPSDAGVPGAQVRATQTDTGVAHSVQSAATGDYLIPSLPAGRYRVTAEAPGFKRVMRDGIDVTAGSTLRIDLTLEVGAVSEQVEVTAQAPLLESDSARVATNVTRQLVDNLPLVVAGRVRSVFDLAILAPETRSGNGFRIGGGQGQAYDIQMDGSSVVAASNNYMRERAPLSAVSVDAVSEFSVEYAGMKAEFGRAAGIINFVTKSGSNNLHGSAFDFLRNDKLDARGFFAASRPIVRQHNFGGTVGGPVWLPKLYNGRNRTFFFLSYEGFRSKTGAGPMFMTIPLNEMYQGDFRGWTNTAGATIPIYDPASTRRDEAGNPVRDAFPNNQIPVSRFSAVANRAIGFRPAEMVPNRPGPRQNYFRDQGAMSFPWNKGSGRIDHQLTPKDQINGLFAYSRWEELAPGNDAPGMPYPYNSRQTWFRRNYSTRLSWVRNITPTTFNSLRFSLMRDRGDVTIVTALDPEAAWGQKLGIKNKAPEDRGFPRLTFTGYTDWSGLGFGFDRGRNTHLANDTTMVRGAHTIKAGVFYQADRWDGGGQHRNNGSFDFSYLATAIPRDQSQNSGNGFASFLLGYPGGSGLETRRNVLQQFKYVGGYLQDDWRVSRKLTVNIGLRYEYTFPVSGGAEVPDQEPGFSNFDPALPNPGAGNRPGAMIFTGSGPGRTGSSAPFSSYPWAFGPRLGIAYSMLPGTVVRAHAGRSFAAVKTTGGSTHYDGFIGSFSWASADLQVFDFPSLLDDGLPAWNQPPFLRPEVSNGQATVEYWQPNAGRPSEYWTWGLDIQHQLPSSTVLTLGYTGTRGLYLTSGLLNYNQIDPRYLSTLGPNLLLSSVTSPAAVQAGITAPYPGFNGTVQRALQQYPQYLTVTSHNGGEKIGVSSYHSMVVKVDKRYSSGLTLLGSYVLSKMFTDAESGSLQGAWALDTYNRRLEKALSVDDQTHIMRASFNYEFPLGRGKSFNPGRGWNYLLGDWSLSAYTEYGSGTPMSVDPGIQPPIYPGAGRNRVTISSYDNWRGPISGESFDPFQDRWWNPNAFQQAPREVLLSTLGNATVRNPRIRSPWVLNENVSLAKGFVIKEGVQASLRAEAFNLFNRVRWGGPNSTYTAPDFGLVRSQANSPRQIQMALRLTF